VVVESCRGTVARCLRATVAVAVLGLAALGAGCGSSTSATPTPSPSPAVLGPAVALTGSNFRDVVLAGQGVSLVEFYSPTCPYCQRMQPVVEQLVTAYRGRALVGQVNVDTEPALVADWAIQAWPTFVVVRNGKEVSRYIGATTYDRLAGMLDSALAAAAH
jgi:thioredoxin 1